MAVRSMGGKELSLLSLAWRVSLSLRVEDSPGVGRAVRRDAEALLAHTHRAGVVQPREAQVVATAALAEDPSTTSAVVLSVERGEVDVAGEARRGH